MLFVELKFFVFFAGVLAVYWNLKSNDHRKWFLLAASYFFYGSWDWRFAVMLFFISYVDYALALSISRSSDARQRKRYVVLSVAMNLTVLGVFKYFNFFVDSAIDLASLGGVHLSQPTLEIILPVGVSFFTFQSLSYTLDVYRREIEPAYSARDYLLFAAFFPQLVAGPIVRPNVFLPQLAQARTISRDKIKAMLFLFMLGFIKKSCIADNVSPYVDQVFLAPDQYGSLALVTAVWLYAVQIFCDFSGYSDMAIAVAGLMGYTLPINFNAPYLSRSLREFWQRWHISLSTWIRDYIYVSLGGRSPNRLLTYRNLMITMLAGGLWHGAAWTFVVWGGLHGFGQVVGQQWRHWFGAGTESTLRALVGWFLTLQFVCICWIFFRATDLSSAMYIVKGYVTLHGAGTATLPAWLLFLGPALLGVQWLMVRMNPQQFWRELSLRQFAAWYGACWAVSLAMLPLGYRPFIYFQF